MSAREGRAFCTENAETSRDGVIEEPLDYDPDDAIGYIEGQPKPDPNAGWLKRLWYRFTGAI